MIFYGIGKNYYTTEKFGLLPNGENIKLIDKNGDGSSQGGKLVLTPEALFDGCFEDVYVFPTNSEEIIERLVGELGYDIKQIKKTLDINKECILGHLEKYKYVMLTTDIDYINYPYFSLRSRPDFTMRPILDQKEKMMFNCYSDKPVEDSIIFIVRDHCFKKFIEYGIIDYLKKKYTRSKWVTVLSDMCDGEYGRISTFGKDYIELLKNNFDLILTYHFRDSKKYDLVYYEQTYPSQHREITMEYDVLFLGKAKNRLNLLHSVYSKLIENNIKCRFIINDVNMVDQVYEKIEYNRVMSYDSYLEEVQKCRCILEICQVGDETSYRFAEAVVNNKKLLVNDTSCQSRKYFDHRYMRCFTNVDDIDIDWIKDDQVVDYKYKGEFEPDRFLSYITDSLNNRK